MDEPLPSSPSTPRCSAARSAGQFLGIGVDALAARAARVLWVPLAFSVVLEALVGRALRRGAPRATRLTLAERGRLSAYYSLGLAALSLPLVGGSPRRTHARARSRGAGLVADFVMALVVVLAGFGRLHRAALPGS